MGRLGAGGPVRDPHPSLDEGSFTPGRRLAIDRHRAPFKVFLELISGDFESVGQDLVETATRILHIDHELEWTFHHQILDFTWPFRLSSSSTMAR